MADDDDSGSRGKRRVLTLVFVAVPLAALGLVLLGIAGGISPRRLWPVAGFLGVAATASVYFWAATRMCRRRAHRLRQTDVVWGVRLTKPMWISMIAALMILGFGAILGTIAASVGFPGIGVGALLTAGALAVWVPFAEFGMSPRGLTFEPAGLRVHIRGATFLVPWTAITNVEQIGPDHSQMIRLRLEDSKRVVESVESSDANIRTRVETFVHGGSGSEGQLMFTPWTAGLDGPTLARTINAAVAGQTDRAN